MPLTNDDSDTVLRGTVSDRANVENGCVLQGRFSGGVGGFDS